MKKKNKKMLLLLLLVFVGLFVFASPVLAAVEAAPGNAGTSYVTCFNDVQIDKKIVNLVHTIILLIQVASPILLVVFGMIDLMKGVMAQKEDEIKKGQQTFVKRIIAAVIVFFVIAVVRMVVSFTADSSKKDNILKCLDYFTNGA